MIIIPLKCKLCTKTISPPNAAGLTDEQYRAAYTAKLMGHIAGHAKEESTTGGPHAQGNAEAAIPAQNLYTALLMGCFDLTPEMEQDRAKVFAMIHALTRKVTISDEELSGIYGKLADTILAAGSTNWFQLRKLLSPTLFDLRDRYEERGKYAPKPANAPAAPEEVKK
jgi:hypothetical protein